MLEVSKHEESKMAENGETADRSSSSSMVIEEELPSFLNALIDKVEQITNLIQVPTKTSTSIFVS